MRPQMGSRPRGVGAPPLRFPFSNTTEQILPLAVRNICAKVST